MVEIESTVEVISVIRQGDSDRGLELDTGWVIDVDQVELIVDETIFDDGTGGTNNGNGYEGSGLTDVNGDGVCRWHRPQHSARAVERVTNKARLIPTGDADSDSDSNSDG